MTNIVEKTSTETTALTDADVKKIVSIVLSDQPNFTNTARIENIKTLLKKTSDEISNAQAQNLLSERLASVAKSVSIAATLGLLTATVAPTLPFASVVAALIGILGGKAASARIERALSQLQRSDSSTEVDSRKPR